MYYFIYITLYKIAVNFTIINIIISVVINITINIIINITIIVITIIIINHQLLVSSLNSLSELLNLSEEIFAMGTTSNIVSNELSALPWSRNRRKVMVMMMMVVVVVVVIMMTTTMIVVLMMMVLLMMMINSIIVDYYYFYYYYYLFTLGSSFDKSTSSSKLKYNLHLHSDSQQKGVTCAHRQDVGYRKRRPPQFRVDTRQDPEHLAEASGTYRRHLRGHVICFRCHEV